MALSESECAESLQSIRWCEDIKYDKIGLEAIQKFLLRMPKLKKLEITGAIHSKTKRDELRANASTRGV